MKNKALSFRQTQEQYDVCNNIAKIAGVGINEFIREAIADKCKAMGVEYPDNMRKRGEYERPKKHKKS